MQKVWSFCHTPKDDKLPDLPPPDVLQQEHIEYLEAALAAFRDVAASLPRSASCTTAVAANVLLIEAMLKFERAVTGVPSSRPTARISSIWKPVGWPPASRDSNGAKASSPP